MDSKYRIITIIEKAYITDLAMLYAHPNVKFVLEAPYDYVVYEFYDELSEFLRYSETQVKYELTKNPYVRQKTKEILQEKESLIKPLYENPHAYDSYGYRKNTNAIGFWIKSGEQTRQYAYLEPGVSKTKKYVGIDCSGINSFPYYSNRILIIVEFKKNSSKTKKKYEEITSFWLDWLKQQNKIETNDAYVEYEDDIGKIKVYFKDNFEDYLAVFPIIVNNQLSFKAVYNIAFDRFD